MKTKQPAKKQTAKEKKNKEILAMSNLIMQRNIDVYRKLASE
jgi:hypothetical protein